MILYQGQSVFSPNYLLSYIEISLFFTVVEKLREMMEEIENAINTFKEEQRLMYVLNSFILKF